MTAKSWDIPEPGRFTVGTSGEPGSRIFFFQVFAEDLEVALKGEKQQAAALAEHLAKLLADLPPSEGAEVEPIEALPPGELAWVVGSISIGVDRTVERVVVHLEELQLDDEGFPLENSPDAGHLRVHLTAEQVRGLIAQVKALLDTSRPVCPLCQGPIDPSGHACPRLN